MCHVQFTCNPSFRPQVQTSGILDVTVLMFRPHPLDIFHEYHPKGKKAYDIHKCDGGREGEGGGREGDTNLNTLNSRLYKLNNKQFARSGGPGSVVGIGTAYWLDGPGIESRWEARFSAPVQTGLEAHPASCTVGAGYFPGVRCGRGVTLTPHPFLVPRSKIE